MSQTAGVSSALGGGHEAGGGVDMQANCNYQRVYSLFVVCF